MILYKNNLSGFRKDVETNKISDAVEINFQAKLGYRINPSEKSSIKNSMSFMERTVRRANLSDSCGVLLEYMIPATSRRVDFIISGEDEEKNKNFVIIELKQWSEATSTEYDGIVTTFVGKAMRDVTHPSYQASSYKTFLKDYNENIDNGLLNPYSCAYLHNYKEKNPEPLKAKIYSELIRETPIYFMDDDQKLEQFLHKYIRFGKGEEILYQIESGKIRPSKKLIDYVSSMYQGNQEFILLDEQKVAYETAYRVALKAKEKSAIIIKGGPGTGKSVVSVNLLGGLLKENLNTIFVAPNASFRNVMTHKLAQKERRTRLNNLFKGSAGFIDTEANTFDVIIVDEAHRLKNKKAYQYWGENQIMDIMNAGQTVIFFVDDDQVIRPEDIGSVKEIKKMASQFGARLYEIELKAQFRCSGAEGYVNWLNNTLHIKKTANFDGWEDETFDFKIFSNPNDMRRAILEKSSKGFNARILAGYAWKWTSVKYGNRDSDVDDVEIPEYDFSMPWNSRRAGSTWAIEETGIHQVGCIHTSQGLEFDYVGVIVGQDLCFDKDKMDYLVDWKSYKDSAGKKGLREKPEDLVKLVKNIYKVLMSRGIKGCYVYFCDKNLSEYFNSRLNSKTDDINKVIFSDQEMYEKGFIPLISIQAAAGSFIRGNSPEIIDWKAVPGIPTNKDMFALKIVGNSMRNIIKNGEIGIFERADSANNGDVVLVQHRDIADSETGGSYSVKRYFRDKNKVILQADTDNPHIAKHTTFSFEEGVDIRIIARYIKKL